jgi:hypothetical protein
VSNFLQSANKVRMSLPYAYWLLYDAVLLPMLVWGFISLSHKIFGIGLVLLGISLFFDLVESIIKWQAR